jgi:hypothetical protein
VFLWVCCVLNMLTMTTKQEHNTQTPLSMLQVEREEAYTRFVWPIGSALGGWSRT